MSALTPSHHPLCRWTPKGPCTCGLDAMRAENAELKRRIRLARAEVSRMHGRCICDICERLGIRPKPRANGTARGAVRKGR